MFINENYDCRFPIFKHKNKNKKRKNIYSSPSDLTLNPIPYLTITIRTFFFSFNNKKSEIIRKK